VNHYNPHFGHVKTVLQVANTPAYA